MPRKTPGSAEAGRQGSSSRVRKANLVMPISSVVLLAIICFAIGIFVGRGLGPANRSTASHSVGAADSAADQPQIDTQKVMSAIESSNNYEMLVSIGNEMFDVGQPHLAIAAYEKALTITPMDPNVRTDLGIMYLGIGQSQKAIDEFETSIRLDPKHENSRFNLGIALAEHGDVQAAIKAYQEYLKVFPNGRHTALAKERLAALMAAER